MKALRKSLVLSFVCLCFVFAGDEYITLKGSPEEIGKKWAKLNGETIKTDFKQFLKDKNITEKELIARGQVYFGLVQKLAPHWKSELDAMAIELGINPDALNAYMGAKYRDVNLIECYSYMVTPGFTDGKKTLFHKNRDNRFKPQCAYIKNTVVNNKKIYKYIGIGDVSDVGVMMMVNEKGLAGCADMGPSENNPRWKGMMNPDILRYVAENAATCEEALAIIKRFTDEKIYAGGKRFTVYVFADKNGKGLRISNDSDKIEYEYADDKFGFLVSQGAESNMGAQKKSAIEGFKTYEGPKNVEFMNLVSRYPAICASINIASLTVEIPKEYTEYLTCAWVSLGRADSAAYIPVYMGSDNTPVKLANGDISRLNKTFEKNKDILQELQNIEKDLYESARQNESQIKAKLAKSENVKDLISDINNKNVSITLKKLESIKGGIK